MEKMVEKIWELLPVYGMKFLAAIVVLVVGRWVAKILSGLVQRLMERSKVDPMLIRFTGSVTYIASMTFVIVAAMAQLGIQTTSFIAVLGAAGLAIGLALQGSLSNFAAGFLMILFRPFKVGDFIEGAGTAGTVEEIQIFTTTLLTPDNKTVIIPNAKLTGDNIVNYTRRGTRRVDMVFGIGYGEDIDKARDIMADIIARDTRVLQEPAPRIAVSELADSSVNFIVRPWTKADDYWNVYWDMTESVKKALDDAGINIPFPQRDVHVYEHKSE
jgi:small conductance mechanosensitive channel